MELRSWQSTESESARSTVSKAHEMARLALADNPERMRHSTAVAARAASLVSAVADREAHLLVAAAWVHDIGYSTSLRDTAFHPLDGARFLRSAGWEPLLCDLVAHHSGSRFVAEVNGFGAELAQFTFTEDPLSDALTIADQTIGPNGVPFSIEERMRDMLERHGPDSPHARAHFERRSYIRSAFQRVTDRLDSATADLPVMA